MTKAFMRWEMRVTFLSPKTWRKLPKEYFSLLFEIISLESIEWSTLCDRCLCLQNYL